MGGGMGIHHYFWKTIDLKENVCNYISTKRSLKGGKQLVNSVLGREA